jgi:LmbE family N-acetylglucosaminyl deacetylase
MARKADPKCRTPATREPEPLRILSIGAHPADIFDQSGGTMAHHVQRGDWVGCCVLTHGARVHDKVIGEQMFHARQLPEAEKLKAMMTERADVKADEVRRACAILGVTDIYFFGADDAVLLVNEALVRHLASFLRQIRPDIILTHFPMENGGVWNSHAVAGQLVMLAVGLAASVDPGDPNKPHRTSQIFFWGQGAGGIARTVWDAHRPFYNDIIIDITDVVEKKLACLDMLVSQGYGGAYARKRIETSDGAFGQAGGVPYGEAFISHSAQTYYHLPLSDYTRLRGKMSDHEIMDAYSYRVPTDSASPSATRT